MEKDNWGRALAEYHDYAGGQGCFWVPGGDILHGIPKRETDVFTQVWNTLPEDTYVGGSPPTRRRVYSRYRYVCASGILTRLPHSPYMQSKLENALYGGIAREFQACPDLVEHNPVFHSVLQRVIRPLMDCSNALDLDVHLVRVLGLPTKSGQPSPEGLHRDGADMVSLTLISRSNARGGETRITNLERHEVARMTLSEPFDTLILDDTRFLHETSPICPSDGYTEAKRDMLLLSVFRQIDTLENEKGQNR